MAENQPNAPTLQSAYSDYRSAAFNSDAYDQEMARIRGSGQTLGQSTSPSSAAPGAPNAAGQPAAVPPGSASPGGGAPTAPAAAQGAPATPQPGAAQPGAVPPDKQDAYEAERARLTAPPFKAERFANPDQAVHRQALSNLGLQEEAAAKDPNANEAAGISLPGRIGTDITELPRDIYSGVHAAIRGVFKMADTVDSSLEKGFKALNLDALNMAIAHEHGAGLLHGYHVLSGQEVEDLKARGAGSELTADQYIPLRPNDPSTTEGQLAAGAVQFVTGMAAAGSQFRALGLPTQLAGWAGRGVSAAQGFLAMFETTDGAQHRLSDLIQSVPALRNPVNEALSSQEGDSEWTGRLKSAVEGTVFGQVADGLVAGIRMWRAASRAKVEAENIVAADAARPPPSPDAGLKAMGDQAEHPDAPIAQVVTKDQANVVPGAPSQDQEKIKAAAAAAAGKTPEEVAAMREPAGAESEWQIPQGTKTGPELTAKFEGELKTPSPVRDTEGKLEPTNDTWEAAKQRYAALPDTKGGRLISADEWKEVSPEFSANKGTRSQLSVDVHEPGSRAAKRMYQEALDQEAPEGRKNLVVATAGGSGAGKTSAIKRVPELQRDVDAAQVILDSNLSTLKSARGYIQDALDHDKVFHYVYVQRDPVDSMVNGALPRAMGKGRTVPVGVLAHNHPDSWNVFNTLREEFKDNQNVIFTVVDNTRGHGNAIISTPEAVAGMRHQVPESELRQAVEDAYERKDINEHVRAGTLGENPRTETSGGAGSGLSHAPGAGGQLEPQRAGGPGSPPGPGREAPLAGPAPPGSPGAREAQAKEPGVYVNFNRIDTSDDLKRSMSELATAFQGDIDAARRGVQTFEQTQLGAQAKDAWKVLMERRQGEPLNDQESLAARQLWASSAAKTMETADIAAKAPTPENLWAFRRQLSLHAAIQQEVIAARTETARALSSWRIPAGEDAQRLQSMMAQLSAQGDIRGGLETALDLAQRVQALKGAGDVEGLGKFVEKTKFAKTRDAVLEAWTNMLLTNPLTHVKVTLSNAATVALRIAERKTASSISNLLGDQDGVAAGEAAAQYAGLIGGLKDSFRYIGKLANSLVSHQELPALGDDPLSNAIKSFKTGEYTLDREPGSEYLQNQGAISSQALGIANSGWLGQGVDYAGQLMRLPGRALTGEHDYFRSIGYLMEKHALATRQATAEVTAGKIPETAFQSRVAELVENPPPDLHMAAVNGTLYQTYTDAPGKLGELVGRARNQVPALRVILPFYKIPARIMSFSLERSPLAPLMSTFRQNMAAGGARQATALAQVGLGTAVMLATADHVLNNRITGAGPTEPGLRKAMENEGWQPYSYQTESGRWVQYNRVETIGSSMAMAADAVEAIRNFHNGVNGDDPDVENLAMATTFAIANDITSKSYLQGLANFFEAMGSPKTGANRFTSSLAGSAIPAGVSAIDRMTDPYKRAAYGMMDTIRARTPGASKDLPPVRNLWGEPVKNDSGMGKAYDLLVPATSRDAAHEPIDKELIKQDVSIARIPTRSSFEGVTIDLRGQPKVYDRLLELAGNGYKDPVTGLGLKDTLNAMVTGKHDQLSPLYNLFGAAGDGPDGHKADMIKDIVRQFRDGAKDQLLHEYPRLAAQVQEKQAAKQSLKMPGM